MQPFQLVNFFLEISTSIFETLLINVLKQKEKIDFFSKEYSSTLKIYGAYLLISFRVLFSK